SSQNSENGSLSGHLRPARLTSHRALVPFLDSESGALLCQRQETSSLGRRERSTNSFHWCGRERKNSHCAMFASTSSSVRHENRHLPAPAFRPHPNRACHAEILEMPR